MSTTIRVDKETHKLLQELSKTGNSTLIETVKDAAEALRRVRFGQIVASEFDSLRADERAWDSYMQESVSTEIADGIS